MRRYSLPSFLSPWEYQSGIDNAYDPLVTQGLAMVIIQVRHTELYASTRNIA